MPTYRTAGAWGPGIGVNLTPAQVDGNFYELRTDLDDVIANPPTADGIVSISQSGFNLTFHTTLGNEIGPIAIPVVYTVWRGEWSPLTLYTEADLFKVDGVGIFAVLQDHTSAATFDPDAAAGSPLAPLYLLIIAVESLPADTSLDDLNDVTITSVANNDFIAWSSGSSAWTNRTPAQVLTILAPTLDSLTDVIAPSPVVGQVLRYIGGSPDAGWQPDTLILDDLFDVSATSPSNGQVLTYQSGSPTGWIAATPAAIPTTLDALTDVTAPTPADGDLLQYDSGSPAGWINAAGQSISGLADVTLPLIGTAFLEVSEPSGSPAIYTSKKIEVDDLFTDRTIAGTTTLPGSGQITSTGRLGLGGTPSAQLHLQGNQSVAGLSIGGHVIRTTAATYTDTTSSGAVAEVTTSNIGQPTLAASSATTYGIASNLRIGGTPLAGTNVTITNPFSLYVVSGNVGLGTASILRGMDGAGTFRTIARVGASFTFLAADRIVADPATGNVGIGTGTSVGAQANLQIGATAATARIYNSFTDASNGEWAYLGSALSNIFTFGPDKNGTGTYRIGRWVSGGLTIWESLINGDFRIGTGSAIATNATGGFPKIPTCAGTPTGVPGNAATGSAEVVYDSTGKKLWIYDNATTSWKGVVVA